jgi:hypothetical protein
MSSSVILKIEVWVFWVVIRESQGSSSSSPSSGCEPSSCAGSLVLVRLWIFHIVDISPEKSSYGRVKKSVWRHFIETDFAVRWPTFFLDPWSHSFRTLITLHMESFILNSNDLAKIKQTMVLAGEEFTRSRSIYTITIHW